MELGDCVQVVGRQKGLPAEPGVSCLLAADRKTAGGFRLCAEGPCDVLWKLFQAACAADNLVFSVRSS